MSSPTFLGDRPRGPTLGAKEEVAPTSPPTALNLTVNTNTLNCQQYNTHTVQYIITVHYTNSTNNAMAWVAFYSEKSFVCQIILPHARTCACARACRLQHEHHTPYLCQCSKYTHRTHASWEPHVVSHIAYLTSSSSSSHTYLASTTFIFFLSLFSSGWGYLLPF